MAKYERFISKIDALIDAGQRWENAQECEMKEREKFENWYSENAYDFCKDPIGSRDCSLQWNSWQAALSAAPVSKELLDVARNLVRAMRTYPMSYPLDELNDLERTLESDLGKKEGE